MTKWTNDTERQFDELVAGLPEGAQNMVKDYAIDAAEFEPIEEAIADGALMATHGWKELEVAYVPTDPSPAIVGETERYHLFPIKYMPEGTGTRLVDTLTDMEVDAYPHWPTNDEVQSAIRGWEKERSESEEEPSWEPAWERDAVMELLRLISVSPQWLTADGAKVLIDAAKDRCGANNGDLVEESDVREAFDALS